MKHRKIYFFRKNGRRYFRLFSLRGWYKSERSFDVYPLKELITRIIEQIRTIKLKRIKI